jgi:hypothetical protein
MEDSINGLLKDKLITEGLAESVLVNYR